MSDHIDSICEVSSSASIVYNHRVRIRDINKAVEDFPNGKVIKGEDFKIPIRYSSLICNIEVYPSGYEVEDEGNLSVFIHTKPNDVSDSKMRIEWSIINDVGVEVNVKSDREAIDEFEYEIGNDDYRSFMMIIDHKNLFDPRWKFLKDGSLTLAFKITILPKDLVMESKQFAYNREGVTIDHFNFMKKLLENPEDFGSDFIIECSGEEEVKCHTNILAANSEVFEGMLAHNSIEKQERRVVMKELEKEMCQTILRYVYTGCLDEDKITMGLYEQADKLGFLQLKEICSQHLIQFVDKDNCISTLVFADANNDENMKEAAADCLDQNAEQLV